MPNTGDITIPANLCRLAGLGEGIPVEFELVTDGILIKAKKGTDPDQWWYWTPEWQAGECEVDANIAAGRGTFYASTDEFLAALESRINEPEDTAGAAE